MKRCPSCQQTYPDDAPDYCSNDGMHLVDEEAASFDPEKTVMASGLRGGGGEPPSASPPTPSAPVPPPAPSLPQQQYQAPNELLGIKPPTQWQPPSEQPPPQQQWQPPGGSPAPQQGWPPSQPQQQAPNWGDASYQQPAAPYGAPTPYAPAQGGRSRALAIAALVTGACAATIMSIIVSRIDKDFTLTSLLVLSILGIGLGVASLILSLQKPSRFGGVPLAIAGLATGTAALVYYFTM